MQRVKRINVNTKTFLRWGAVFLFFLWGMDVYARSGVNTDGTEKEGPLDKELTAVFNCHQKTPKACPALQALLDNVEVSFPGLIQAVAQYQNDHRRAGAATVIGWLNEPAHLPLLFKAYKTSHSAVSKEAVVGAIARIGTPEVIPWLNKVRETNDIGTLIIMANAYGTLGKAEGVGPLLEMSKSYHPKVRAAAMNALGHIGNVDAIDPLLNILLTGEGKSNVEERALWALGKLKADVAAPALLVLLFNDSSEVRIRAARVLGELKPSYMVPVLQMKLESEDTEVAGEVALAGAHLGDKRLVPAMNWAAMNPILSKRVRGQLFWAIGMMGDERSVPPLLMLLKTEDQNLLVLTVETLGNLGHVSAGPHLLKLLEHNMLEVREMAAWSLEKISGLHHGDDYAAWEEWLIEASNDEDSNE